MKYRVNSIMRTLRSEKINSWFDLNLLLDSIKDNRADPSSEIVGTFDSFKRRLQNGGVAFITFYYSIDGATLEAKKYASAFQKIIHGIPTHFIAGSIHPDVNLPEYAKRHSIPEMKGFDDWKLYTDFFFTKLKRGNAAYNRLIKDFWDETLVLTEQLGHYIEDQHIQLLYVINTHSNPGNVSLALAIVLLSEYMGIPIINNNHDFYWEGGNRKMDILTKKLKAGPRDFFFLNSDVGEFFSIINMLYPWESRSWVSVNINTAQTKTLIEQIGHNPANVKEISTSVDVLPAKEGDERRKIETLAQMKKIFSRGTAGLESIAADTYLASLTPSTHTPDPVLIGLNDVANIRLTNSIIFLQPTRIIERKRIDLNVDLLKKLCNDTVFSDYFRETKQFNILVLVSGPIALGHDSTFKKIIEKFAQLKMEIDPYFHDKIFFGFLFSAFDDPSYTKRFPHPIQMHDLYSCASLTLLPSETEGRGLPIIESAAAGVPIFCRRYYPEAAYAQVIGEHLPLNEQLKTIEFRHENIGENSIRSITDRLIHPLRYTQEMASNRRIVEKRFRPEALKGDVWHILHTLYKQLHPNFDETQLARDIILRFQKKTTVIHPLTKELLRAKNRQYVPGYGKVGSMLYLKSLIDPSFFRIEEQNTRGMVMKYAMGIVERYRKVYPLSFTKIHRFYNAVDQFFLFHQGYVDIRADHSLAYRHRNTFFYPYRELTFQELAGAVNLAFEKIVKPHQLRILETIKTTTYIQPLRQSLLHLTDSDHLSIDQSVEMEKKLSKNVPFAYFPGRNIVNELDTFIIRTMRVRLQLKPEENLTKAHVQQAILDGIEPATIIIQNKYAWYSYSVRALKEYISRPENVDLRLLLEGGLCRIVSSKQASLGVHFQQMGTEALHTLTVIKEKNGFLITIGEDAAMTTDIVDIDVFHIGTAERILTAKIMGIPQGGSFVEWVPPGLRPTLAYPTPIQTSKSFAEILTSELFRDGVKKMGKRNLLNMLRDDADLHGTPLGVSLKNVLFERKKKKRSLRYSYLTGVYQDGSPYSGVIASLHNIHPDKKWKFRVLCANDTPKTANEFLDEFHSHQEHVGRIAWNGGYILNAELIGKLGLSQAYIGSPLGLIISNGQILSLPLFNKPAVLFSANGHIQIKRVTIRNGCTLIHASDSTKRLRLSHKNYNRSHASDQMYFYDLLYEKGEILGDERIICRLSGRVVKEIIHTTKGQNIPHVPIGLTLSFPKQKFPVWIKKNMQLRIEMKEFRDVQEAIEAGPLLIRNGKMDIDMKREGWKTANSIATQASRIDYEDMRGPKIAMGLDRDMRLCIVVVNGRIRESVGARHQDMARILKDRGIVHAMEFDPGGSATLVVDGKTLNISPYNHDFEKDIYSLPPEERPISSMIVGYEVAVLARLTNRAGEEKKQHDHNHNVPFNFVRVKAGEE